LAYDPPGCANPLFRTTNETNDSLRFADLPGFFGPVVTGEQRQLRGPAFSDQS
jgi:hypothetical protein